MRELLQGWRDRFSRHPLTVWYSSLYRFPIPSLEATSGMPTRRADFVAWYLLDRQVVPQKSFRTPIAASYADICRVHTPDYVESLSQQATIGRIFASSPQEVPVDAIMHSVRLACGATLAAARETLRTREPALNLLGGFHHAGKTHGGGFCALNDMAIACAALRNEGFPGRVCVIDLDAHQPDGSAECLQDDQQTWIGSLSGSSWGDLPRIDETILPEGTSDGAYLEALRRLLSRMPAPDLAFVVAGGDVLAGDRLGRLRLTLDGTRRRDLQVREALDGIPSVWLPAGGYSDQAWQALGGTALALALHTREPMSPQFDPMRAHFKFVAANLGDSDLAETAESNDIAEALGLKRSHTPRLLGYYTVEGTEHAFYRYGLLDHLERLGYSRIRFVIDDAGQGDRLRVFGTAAGAEHLLIEIVLEKKRLDEGDLLYVHWVTLRHPASAGRGPLLPGQEVPGLGLAKETGNLLARMAARLGLDGVAFRPATFHTAYAGRQRLRFIDPARQARFDALVRDLSSLSLHDATVAVAEGRVRLNGAPYAWEPDLMILWLRQEDHQATIPQGLPEYHFTVEPK